jgi:hypothetical protein
MYYRKPFSFQVKGAMSVCECGESIYAPFSEAPSYAVARHLEAKLIEAGFNPVPEPVEQVEQKEPDLGPCPYPGKCPSVCWGCG